MSKPPHLSDIGWYTELLDDFKGNPDVYSGESLKYYRDIKNVVDTSRQEGVEEGMAKGLEVGLSQGIEQGREEERLVALERQRSLNLRQLYRKLGEIPTELEDLVKQLEMESLEELSEGLFDFEEIEDLRGWLEQQE